MLQIISRIILGVSVLLCLSSCLTPSPPILREAPVTALEIAYEGSSNDPAFIVDDWPEEEWWVSFQDPQLEELISLAIRDNPSITIAEARVRAALALSKQSSAYVFPKFDYDLDITSIKQSKNGIFGVLNATDPSYPLNYFQKNMAIQMSYEFDFFKKHKNEFLATMSEAQALAIEAYAARLTLSISVAQSYFKLQISKMREQVARQLAENRNRIVEITQQRQNNGLETLSNVNQSRLDKLSTDQFTSQLQEDIMISKNELQALIAADFMARIDDVELCEMLEPFPIPSTLSLDLLAHRPDVWAQRWRVEGAARKISVANAEFYPNINLIGAYGLQAISPNPFIALGSQWGFLYGPALHLPLFRGGALIANHNVRVAEYDEAIGNYDSAVITAAKEVLNALATVEKTTERYRYALDNEKIIAENVQQARELSKRTIKGRIDLLNAENDWFQSIDTRLQSLQDSFLARLALIHALGGGFEICE